MKIARVVPFLDFGGIEKVVQIAALEFSRKKYLEHIVVVLGSKGRIAAQLKSHGIEVICISQNPRIPNFILILKLYKLFRKGNFDVVHTSGAEANFHGIIAATLASVKTRIIEEIGFPNHHLAWKIVFRFIYSLATKAIVISEAVNKMLIEIGELRDGKAKVIYNPAQIPINLSIKKKRKSYLTFVMVCRLTAIKNIPSALEAFAGLKSSYLNRYKLMLIGDGEDMEFLKNKVIEMGLENIVAFFGYRAVVSDYLKKADVFLIPSFSEGSSVALTEAMLHGLPSIVTSVGGASEIIGSSKSAVLVDPNSITEIRNALKYFLDLPEAELEIMGSRAKQFASLHFSPQKYAKELLTLYRNPY
jgi:glycosyltransferase involved in cell wall biosynthesis